MRPLEPLGTMQGFGFGLFLFVFGMIFVVTGLAFGASQGGATLRGGDLGMIFGAVLFVAFFVGIGGMTAFGGLAQAILYSRFGKPLAEISADVRPGETFRFSYTQPLRRSTDISRIGVFLVFREGVTSESAGETERSDFDRLIQSYTNAGHAYAAGERLTVEHVFQLPRRAMGVRNPYMKRTKAAVRSFWIVKVRLTLRNRLDVWREYALPVEEEGEALLRQIQTKMPEGQFEVHLQYNSGKGLLRMSKILEPVLPHLPAGAGIDLHRNRPCLLRENLTEQEAEAIKERLAAVGVTVMIQPAQQDTSL